MVFELGFFVGALGPDRVAALVKGEVEKPSDFDGVMYISMDEGESWKTALAKELQAAGFEVDFSKLVRSVSPNKPTSQSPTMFSLASSSYKFHPGEYVFHSKLGRGIVVAIIGNKLEVDFHQAGRRTVLDSFVSSA